MEVLWRMLSLGALTALASACGGGDDAMMFDDVAPDRASLDAEVTPTDSGPDAPPDGVMDVSSDEPRDVRDASVDAGDARADVTDVTDVRDVADVPATAVVAHAREFRAAWVATVYNINFPSSTRLSASAAQAELTAMLDVMQRNRLNAVVFQVRPEGDAVYRSTLEPWSRFLTGRQGGDPGYDPLAVLVTEAHRRGIEVHAWFNPYRAKGSASSTAVAPHITVTNPSAVVPYNGMLWMNPALPVVQDRLLTVIRDVVTRYDIDGVHFDDYFYPYPQTGMPFPDSAQFDSYRMGGGTMSLGDWRRDNVNRMVERVSATAAAARPDVRFGISPFGIYRPGMPAGISGLDAYAAIYCDPVRWMREGWVDYLAPQLYWPSTQTAQAYGSLIAWWAGITTGGRSIFAGNNLGQLGSSSAWSVEEFRRQITLTRAQESRGARGNIWFTVQPFQSNRMGIADVMRGEFYQRVALTPPMAGTRRAPAAPTVRAEGRTLRIAHADARTMRAWVLYREVSGRWELDRIVPAGTGSADVTMGGRYAVSAANRFGDESAGTVVSVL